MKKLRLSKRNRIFLGVCGGFAEYFNVDPTLVRAIAILLSITGGIGIIAYLVVAFVMSQAS